MSELTALLVLMTIAALFLLHALEMRRRTTELRHMERRRNAPDDNPRFRPFQRS